MANILCEHADDCLRIRLDNGTANALTTAVIQDLAHAVEDANRDARGAMLCGGEKFFCNGLDLDWALACSRAEISEMFHALAGLILAMLESPLPIVGAIKRPRHRRRHGHLPRLRLSLRRHGRVLIGKPEILLGVPNPYYGDQLLRFVAGDFVASDLIYTGKLVRAEEGRALGLVHETGPKEDIERRRGSACCSCATSRRRPSWNPSACGSASSAPTCGSRCPPASPARSRSGPARRRRPASAPAPKGSSAGGAKTDRLHLSPPLRSDSASHLQQTIFMRDTPGLGGMGGKPRGQAGMTAVTTGGALSHGMARS